MGNLKICNFCGKEFESRHPAVQYCSKSCKNKAQRRRRRQREAAARGYVYHRVCRHCKKEFDVHDHRVNYCSVECRSKAAKEYRVVYNRRYAEKVAEREEKKKAIPSLSEVARLAREQGLTYGQYMIMIKEKGSD